jgi:hypothetical protein
VHISNWVKGEVFTLDALIMSVNFMQGIDAERAKTIKDIKDVE